MTPINNDLFFISRNVLTSFQRVPMFHIIPLLSFVVWFPEYYTFDSKVLAMILDNAPKTWLRNFRSLVNNFVLSWCWQIKTSIEEDRWQKDLTEWILHCLREMLRRFTFKLSQYPQRMTCHDTRFVLESFRLPGARIGVILGVTHFTVMTSVRLSSLLWEQVRWKTHKRSEVGTGAERWRGRFFFRR